MWKDKREMHMLTNMHNPLAECNFCDNNGNALKSAIVEDYNRHMGYVVKRDRMANSYTISCHTCKWTKKLFFHLLDLTILNSYILSSSCGKKFSHRDVRDMLTHARKEPGCEKHLKDQHMCHPSG
jgi:hypothetical protein